jgi:hypothetical protein
MTRLGTGRPGFDFQQEQGFFSLCHYSQTGCRAQPASYPVGTGGSFPGVKRPVREADHSHPSSAKVENVWSYTSTPYLLGMVRIVCFWFEIN